MKLALATILLLSFYGHSQILDNADCNAFTDDPFFNTVFIKQNKIKSIRGAISTKRKLNPIKSRGLSTFYQFDEGGKMELQYNTHFKSSGEDTTVVTYTYDDLGRLVTKRRNDNYGFYSYNYEFDSTGQVSSEKYCRDENANQGKAEFKLGKQYVIVNESFQNEWVNDKELRRRYINNYGRPYQEKVTRWDDKGYLVEEEVTLLLNSKKNKTTYEYDEKGHVIKKTHSSNVTGNSTLVYEYAYDEVGNLIESNEYRNGSHITKREVIYHPNMLMKAIIVVDIATEYMSIVRYEYEFYE